MRRPPRRRPERIIAAAFWVTALAGAGFAAVYTLGGQVQLEGGLLGLAFAGLALGLGLWAKRLAPQGPFVEEHEPFQPSPEERRALEEEFEEDTTAIGRRRFLGRTAGFALGVLGMALLFPLRSLGPRPPSQLFHTAWRAGSLVVRETGEPLRPGDVGLGEVLTVFPEGHTKDGDVATLLARVDPARLDLPPRQLASTVDGLIAYSKLCTHLGCPVGLYEQETGRVFCPCHQSAFSLLDGAAPLAGPATRPLPYLPIRVGPDGLLRAGGDFSAPVGPGFWERPNQGTGA
ncbi:MAG TPA: Rieske 2Fe-2S domain-containing protein [Actinomycetota bacterium]|jgi:ubiquinol-cytochrome c reductase iron-sulfur subunit|nr:Rieske 2Fe-2S domain-containing protein [Actinomycetota bacterium]